MASVLMGKPRRAFGLSVIVSSPPDLLRTLQFEPGPDRLMPANGSDPELQPVAAGLGQDDVAAVGLLTGDLHRLHGDRAEAGMARSGQRHADVRVRDPPAGAGLEDREDHMIVALIR